MIGTATLVRTVVDRPDRHIAVYRVDPPIAWVEYTAEGDDSHTSDHVCASGVVAYSGEETFLFPCDDPGVDPPITSFHELYPGSFRGAIDHAQALAGAGYAIADPAVTTSRSA